MQTPAKRYKGPVQVSTAKKKTTLSLAKIAGHQFRGPSGFAYFNPRSKTSIKRFNIQDRSTVNGIEFAHADFQAVDALETTSGHSNTVGAVFGPLREDTHIRPIRTAARVARSGDDFLVGNLAEVKDNLDVRIFAKPQRTIGWKPRFVQFDS